MKIARIAATLAAIAAAANLLAVVAAPRVINAVVMHRIAAAAGGVNRAFAAPRADARARAVVRPSPDLLYTACVFDLSDGPVRLTAPVQDSYVSVSGFAADTTNFFAINDAAVKPGPDGRKRFDVVVAAQPVAAPAGARVVVAPSLTGLILFRSLITREADLPKLCEFQSRQQCAPLGTSQGIRD